MYHSECWCFVFELLLLIATVRLSSCLYIDFQCHRISVKEEINSVSNFCQRLNRADEIAKETFHNVKSM